MYVTSWRDRTQSTTELPFGTKEERKPSVWAATKSFRDVADKLRGSTISSHQAHLEGEEFLAALFEA